MNRRMTNFIRFLMDDVLPPVIRDTKWFMYPFYHYWFRGSRDIDTVMRFKEVAYSLSDEQWKDLYEGVKCARSNSSGDASEESLAWILDRIDPESKSLLDVGCGRGYWLSRCAGRGMALTGCDIAPSVDLASVAYCQGSAERLPFADNTFDVVTCFHVLEHLRNFRVAVSELKRVARRQLMLMVPCQRYFKYTLDLHLQFFYSAEHFKALVEIDDCQCVTLGQGSRDIVFLANLSKQEVAPA
jgi:SAM-dependent methyltransferase